MRTNGRRIRQSLLPRAKPAKTNNTTTKQKQNRTKQQQKKKRKKRRKKNTEVSNWFFYSVNQESDIKAKKHQITPPKKEEIN